jgi:hypothetical protein
MYLLIQKQKMSESHLLQRIPEVDQAIAQEVHAPEFVHEENLARSSVESGAKLAKVVMTAETRDPEFHRDFLEVRKEHLHLRLQVVRSRVSQLRSDRKDDYNKELDRLSGLGNGYASIDDADKGIDFDQRGRRVGMPQIFVDWKNAAAAKYKKENPKSKAEFSWTDWVTDPGVYTEVKDASTSSSEVKDQQLLNFLQWHLDTTLHKQYDPEFLQEVENQKAIYSYGVLRGVKEKWLDPSAVTRLSEIDDVKIYAGDYLQTENRGVDGFALISGGTIVLSQNSIVDKTKDALVHELNHASLGRLDEYWLNEAVTEHINLVFAGKVTDGLPNTYSVVDPEQRPGTYEGFRKLLAILIGQDENGVDAKVDIKNLLLAYSADTDEKRQHYMALFDKDVDTYWGKENARGYIADKIHEHSELVRKARKDERLPALSRKEVVLEAVDVLVGFSQLSKRKTVATKFKNLLRAKR